MQPTTPRLFVRKQPSTGQRLLRGALIAFAAVLMLKGLLSMRPQMPLRLEHQLNYGPTLVSYSYFEKDEVQRANFEFFLAVGMGVTGVGAPNLSKFQAPRETDFVVVVNGESCTPCATLRPLVTESKSVAGHPALSGAWVGGHITLLQRSENEGMDFGAHNATIGWLGSNGALKKYKYFIFLNSSVRGPFYPHYMPTGWQWTNAFTDRLKGAVKLVSSSITCLPHVDAGGYGAKAESWAYALDAESLELLQGAGVFRVRREKFGSDSVVISGEYGVTHALFKAGYNIATLMTMYDPDTDWRDSSHWNCNNNVHPSRHGTYNGISMHPYETMFIKASWHVGEPFVQRYTQWFLARAAGQANTAGSYDESLYWYAVSPDAEHPQDMEQCYHIPKDRLDVWGKPRG